MSDMMRMLDPTGMGFRNSRMNSHRSEPEVTNRWVNFAQTAVSEEEDCESEAITVRTSKVIVHDFP